MWLEIDAAPNGDGDGRYETWEFERWYRAQGVNAWIHYGWSSVEVLHGAIPGPKCAHSKCGAFIRMTHDAHEMEGGDYGHIVH